MFKIFKRFQSKPLDQRPEPPAPPPTVVPAAPASSLSKDAQGLNVYERSCLDMAAQLLKEKPAEFKVSSDYRRLSCDWFYSWEHNSRLFTVTLKTDQDQFNPCRPEDGGFRIEFKGPLRVQLYNGEAEHPGLRAALLAAFSDWRKKRQETFENREFQRAKAAADLMRKLSTGAYFNNDADPL